MDEDMEEGFQLLLLRNQLCFPTYAAANKIIRRYQPLLKELDLTYTQYLVMMVLWEKESVKEKELTQCLYLKANTLAPLLRKLTAKGYLEAKRSDCDRRSLVISLTEEGARLRERAVSIPRTLAEERIFTPEEAMQYKLLLYKILESKE